MTSFPLLNPEIIANTDYPWIPNHTFPTSGRRWIDFMFSRGCFRRCDFCVAGCTPNCHVTASDYEMVDKQLRTLVEYGYEELIIQDDAFLWDKRHVQVHLPAVLGLLKKYGLYWQNNGGIDFEAVDDFVTTQIVKYNKEGNGKVTSLYIPFNPRTWNKQQSAAKSMATRYHANLDNLKRLREAGIYVFTSSIIGTPEQTMECFEDELEADRELVTNGYIDCALPLSATMLPGTKWFHENRQNIVNQFDWSGYSLFTTHHGTANFKPQEIEILMIRWLKEMDGVQKTYPWQTAFPNCFDPVL
jgi:radical SAM superfamily enzyme YgiQ (UPF0313 family)